MQEMCKNKNREEKNKKRSLVVFPFLSCRFPNVAIFEEFFTFDVELNKVIQALDEVVVHLLPPPPDQVPPQQGHAQTLSHTYFTILRVNQIVIMTWTQISLGQMYKTLHHSG